MKQQRIFSYSSYIQISLVIWLLGTIAARAQTYLHAPAVDEYAKHDPAGTTILPNGRYLRPEGKHFPIGRNPYGLATSRDGNQLFIASEEIGRAHV